MKYYVIIAAVSLFIRKDSVFWSFVIILYSTDELDGFIPANELLFPHHLIA